MDLSIVNIPIDEIKTDLLLEKNISLKLLRLDMIHPIVSGNKFFKLYYNA
jgi:1-aminocyclopropane-1-carboxylate deaminase